MHTCLNLVKNFLKFVINVRISPRVGSVSGNWPAFYFLKDIKMDNIKISIRQVCKWSVDFICNGKPFRMDRHGRIMYKDENRKWKSALSFFDPDVPLWQIAKQKNTNRIKKELILRLKPTKDYSKSGKGHYKSK